MEDYYYEKNKHLNWTSTLFMAIKFEWNNCQNNNSIFESYAIMYFINRAY